MDNPLYRLIILQTLTDKMKKTQIGFELLNQLKKGYDTHRIARWAYNYYIDNLRELSEKSQALLENIFFMEEGPEFIISEQELYDLADSLIIEGEQEEPLEENICETAKILEERWVMCPICTEAWHNESHYRVITCPKCNSLLHNPHYKILEMTPDVYIKVRFKTSAEGGRKTPIKPKTPPEPNFYACPLIVDGKAYDCRLLIEDKEIELGKFYEIPVQFLDKDIAMPNLSIGKNITLWEGKEVANGQIIRIC